MPKKTNLIEEVVIPLLRQEDIPFSEREDGVVAKVPAEGLEIPVVFMETPSQPSGISMLVPCVARINIEREQALAAVNYVNQHVLGKLVLNEEGHLSYVMDHLPLLDRNPDTVGYCLAYVVKVITCIYEGIIRCFVHGVAYREAFKNEDLPQWMAEVAETVEAGFADEEGGIRGE